LSGTKRLSLPGAGFCAAALVVVLWLGPQAQVLAQQSEAPPSSKGENFSAGKPPAQLFASDCTGAGCHKGPQGLTKRLLPGSLAGFLREHYTNSRESAAALANYLSKLPSAPEPKEREARTPRPARPAPGTPGWADGVAFPSPSESGSVSRPDQKESRTPRQTTTRTSRAPAKPEDEAPDKPATAAAPVARAGAGEPGDKPAPSSRTAQQGRQPAAAPAITPDAVPTAPSPPQSASTAPAASPPAPAQFDIFD
jgi:hypothetical protein